MTVDERAQSEHELRHGQLYLQALRRDPASARRAFAGQDAAWRAEARRRIILAGATEDEIAQFDAMSREDGV